MLMNSLASIMEHIRIDTQRSFAVKFRVQCESILRRNLWKAQFEFTPSTGSGVESTVAACIDFEEYVPATTIFDIIWYVKEGKWE